MGVQYILTRHDFLFDYDRSSLVDDKKSASRERSKIEYGARAHFGSRRRRSSRTISLVW